jgi:hypothetical protein
MNFCGDLLKRYFRRARVVPLASLLAAAAFTAAAAYAASGGQNPSQGPNLAVTSHAFSACQGISREWWGFPNLIANDQVVLDINGSDVADFYIYGPKTDDYNWRDQSDLRASHENGTNHERVTFTATEGSGRYLLLVSCGGSTAYDFTVSSVRHLTRVDLVPRPVSIPYRGTLRVNVLNGAGTAWNGGAPLTMYAAWGGKAHPVGQATAVNGVAAFNYSLPRTLRKKAVTVWAVMPATDTALGSSSSHVSVRVR